MENRKSLKSDPMISVLIVSRNNSRTIEGCIKSAAYIGWENYEIIVVDGGSVDGSKTILSQLEKEHADVLRVVYKDSDTAPGTLYNTALSEAKGKYVFWIHPEDRVGDICMLKSISHMEDENADILRFDPRVRTLGRRVYIGEEYLKEVLAGCFYSELCGAIYKKEIFDNVSFNRQLSYRTTVEYDAFPRICGNAKKVIIEPARGAYCFAHNGAEIIDFPEKRPFTEVREFLRYAYVRYNRYEQKAGANADYMLRELTTPAIHLFMTADKQNKVDKEAKDFAKATLCSVETAIQNATAVSKHEKRIVRNICENRVLRLWVNRVWYKVSIRTKH